MGAGPISQCGCSRRHHRGGACNPPFERRRSRRRGCCCPCRQRRNPGGRCARRLAGIRSIHRFRAFFAGWGQPATGSSTGRLGYWCSPCARALYGARSRCDLLRRFACRRLACTLGQYLVALLQCTNLLAGACLFGRRLGGGACACDLAACWFGTHRLLCCRRLALGYDFTDGFACGMCRCGFATRRFRRRRPGCWCLLRCGLGCGFGC